MRNHRRPSAPKQAGRGESDSNEKNFTNLPYEILIVILSLLPIKDALVTSSVCKKWKFVWCGLTRLNFDASESFNKIRKNWLLHSSERFRYIKQVNSVIRSYNHPVVHRFRIHFDLSYLNQQFIDLWLQFAVIKKVEILELDMEDAHEIRACPENYDFPLLLSNRVVELLSLKKLYLNNVKVRDIVLEELLKRSTHLESISIHGSRHLTRIRVGGRSLNLKHFEIKDCLDLNSLYLSDFDLVSFTYKGPPIDLLLTNLPKLKEVATCQGLLGLKKNVFSQISSVVSSLQALSFTLRHPKKIAKLDSIPQLPNVQKLKLTIAAEEDDSLLEFTSIAEACPSLETFVIELLWLSPIKRRRKATHVASDHPLENLKIFQILGYYGRISDLELVAYVIHNAAALKKIVIDPRCQDLNVLSPYKNMLKMEEAARSSLNLQLKSIVPKKPPGVKLVIL